MTDRGAIARGVPRVGMVLAESVRPRGATRARLTVSIGLVAIVALSLSGQALAATTWTDPVGDALFHAPPYADIVAASVEEDAGMFEFTGTVAGSIPEDPRLTPPGVVALRWAFPLDLDPTTRPAGWPVAPGQSAPPEGFVAVAWDGNAYSAALYDRRPLLSGGDVEVTSVPFEIAGDTVRVWLDGALIDDPASFRVGFATAAVSVPLGTIVDTKRILDSLPQFYNAWP